MAITVPNLIKERKFPFILTLSVLLLCFAFLIFTNTKSNPYLLFSTSTASTSTSTTATSALQSSLPSSPPPPRQNDGVAAAEVINADPNSPRIDWKLCKGTVAVDFIPCLDNFKAIKALKARRHMEHRERHCPDPNPRCLVPLPAGYRIPLPWPKSRDMVRYGIIMSLTQSLLSTRRTKTGCISLVITSFSLEVALNSRMELLATLNL